MANISATRLVIRAVLTLPTPILRALGGGRPWCRGGRTLDPRFQFLFHAAPASLAGPPGDVAQERANAARGAALVTGPVDPSGRIEDFTIDGPGGPLPIRAYRPAYADPAAPVLVYAHGGGGVSGDLQTSHAACSVIAATARCAVLSVDYRLAPEHRFRPGWRTWPPHGAGPATTPPGSAAGRARRRSAAIRAGPTSPP